MDVGLVFLAYFGVCGVFCSVAGSWVVKVTLKMANFISGNIFRGYFEMTSKLRNLLCGSKKIALKGS